MSKRDLLIRGARVIDPESGLDGVRDLRVENGRIAAVTEPGSGTPADAGLEIVEAAGQ